MLNENTSVHENSNEVSETKIINVNDLVEVVGENENTKSKY
jgi:hypothetical protein